MLFFMDISLLTILFWQINYHTITNSLCDLIINVCRSDGCCFQLSLIYHQLSQNALF